MAGTAPGCCYIQGQHAALRTWKQGSRAGDALPPRAGPVEEWPLCKGPATAAAVAVTRNKPSWRMTYED